MAVTERAQKNHDERFPGRVSTLATTRSVAAALTGSSVLLGMCLVACAGLILPAEIRATRRVAGGELDAGQKSA